MPQPTLNIPQVVSVAQQPTDVARFTELQQAYDAIADAGPDKRYVIFLGPGTYDLPVAAKPCVAIIATHPEATVIRVADATLMTMADEVVVEGVTFELASPTAARTLIAGGAATGVVFRRCRFAIDAPGAFAHALYRMSGAGSVRFERCTATVDGAGAMDLFVNDAAGGTFAFQDCDFDTGASALAAVFRSDVAGDWTILNTTVRGAGAPFRVSQGTLRCARLNMLSAGASVVTGGSVTVKSGPQEYELWPGLVPQHALDAAAADTPAPGAANPYAILFHAGVYAPLAVDGVSWVALRAVGGQAANRLGWPGGVVLEGEDAPALAIGGRCLDLQVEGLTCLLSAPTAARQAVSISGQVYGLGFKDVVVLGSAAGAFAHRGFAIGSDTGSDVSFTNVVVADLGANSYAVEVNPGAAGGGRTDLTAHDLATRNVGTSLHLTGDTPQAMLTGGRLEATVGILMDTASGGVYLDGVRYASVALSAGAILAAEIPNATWGAASVVQTGGTFTCETGPRRYECVAGMRIGDALAALGAAGGGAITCWPGRHTIDAVLSIPGDNITLEGVGDETELFVADGANCTGLTAVQRTGLTLRSFKLNGNRANQADSSKYGIYFDRVTRSAIENVHFYQTISTALYWNDSVSNSVAEGKIVGCIVEDVGTGGGADVGKGIAVGRQHHMTISNCHVYKAGSQGIWTSGANEIKISGCSVRSCDGGGVWLSYGSTHGSIGDCVVDGCNLQTALVVGDYSSASNCIVLNSGDIVLGAHASATGVVTDTPVGYGFRLQGEYSRLSGCEVVASTGYGVLVEGAGAYTADHCELSNVACQGCAGTGIRVNADHAVLAGCVCDRNGLYGFQLYRGNISSCRIVNCTASRSQRHGIYIESNWQAGNWMTGILIDGCHAFDNDQSNGGYYGLEIIAKHYQIVDSFFYDDQGGGATQDYGLRLDGGDDVLVANCWFSGNTAGPVLASATNVVWRANRGYRTEGDVLSAAFAIDSTGVKTVVIPHGLDVTPAVQDCQLTVVQETAVDDWGCDLLKVVSTDAANVTAKVRVSTASATGGATARLGLKAMVA